jgi:predicted transcriptional regulator
MDIALTADQESRLAELAARDGRSAGEIATEAIARYLDDEARFAEMVGDGIAAADRGEFVPPPDEVWARVERILKS